MVCGACGRRMHASYRSKSTAYYVCTRRRQESSDCSGLASGAIDDLVTTLVLRALEPAALEVSLKAVDDVEQERRRLHRHWEQRLERATYEAQRAERRYQSVEPENRLVARSLEQQWEKALREQRMLLEEHDRFLKQQPPRLTEEERDRIREVEADISALWHAPKTTVRDRKEIIRLLTECIVVNVRTVSERTEVLITWRHGETTHHQIARAVSRYESLAEYDRMMDRLAQLRREGLTMNELAARLTREGFRTPRSQKGYTSTSVRQLLSRRGLTGGRDRSRATRRRRVVVARPGREARGNLGATSGLGTPRAILRTSGSARGGPGIVLGRRRRTVAAAQAFRESQLEKHSSDSTNVWQLLHVLT